VADPQFSSTVDAALARKNRRKVMVLFAIAFGTLAASYGLFFLSRGEGPWGTTNNGTFVDPPLTIDALILETPAGGAVSLASAWQLWIVCSDGCEAGCRQAVHQLRQLHALLNKDAQRVRRALVADGVTLASPWLADYPRLQRLMDRSGKLEDGLYIVDPLGNLVLHYPYAAAGKPLLQDLKKLLKVSKIG